MPNRSTTKRLVLLNRYYKITQFYSFLKSTAIKGGSAIAIFVLVLLALEYFILDINSILNNIVHTYEPQVIILTFSYNFV